MRRINPWMVSSSIMLAATLLFACATQKEPAEKAVAQVEAALAALKDDAAKYASAELQAVETQVGALKEKLAKKDYKAVLAEAPQVQAAVASLQSDVAGKKAAATEQWNSLSADVPKMVAAIQSRVDILGQSRKLPKNVSQAAFDSAKSGLEYMKSTWAEATSAFSSGDASSAIDKANAVKQKGNEVLQSLGMTPS
jgi:hypothetical protein